MCPRVPRGNRRPPPQPADALGDIDRSASKRVAGSGCKNQWLELTGRFPFPDRRLLLLRENSEAAGSVQIINGRGRQRRDGAKRVCSRRLTDLYARYLRSRRLIPTRSRREVPLNPGQRRHRLQVSSKGGREGTRGFYNGRSPGRLSVPRVATLLVFRRDRGVARRRQAHLSECRESGRFTAERSAAIVRPSRAATAMAETSGAMDGVFNAGVGCGFEGSRAHQVTGCQAVNVNGVAQALRSC